MTKHRYGAALRSWTIQELDDHPLPEGWEWGKRNGRWHAYAAEDGSGWESGDIVEVVGGQVYRVDVMGEVWPAPADVAFAVIQVSRGHDSPEAMVKALEIEMEKASRAEVTLRKRERKFARARQEIGRRMGLDSARAMLRRRSVQP